ASTVCGEAYLPCRPPPTQAGAARRLRTWRTCANAFRHSFRRATKEPSMNTRPLASMRIAGLATLACLIGSGTALAQYTGPDARKTGPRSTAHTVAEVLGDARDDRPVELTGHLLRQTGDELYLFKDDTGEITVEIDDEDFPANRPVDASVLVKLRGEIDARAM